MKGAGATGNSDQASALVWVDYEHLVFLIAAIRCDYGMQFLERSFWPRTRRRLQKKR